MKRVLRDFCGLLGVLIDKLVLRDFVRLLDVIKRILRDFWGLLGDFWT